MGSLLQKQPARNAFVTIPFMVITPAIRNIVISLYVLNFSGNEGLQMNLGNLITMFCAVIWSIQVTYLSYAGRTTKTSLLTILPLMFASVIAGAAALFTGGFRMDGVPMGTFLGVVVLLVLVLCINMLTKYLSGRLNVEKRD